MEHLISKLKNALAALGGLLVALLGAFLYGKAKGVEQEEDEAKEKTLETVQKANEVHHEVSTKDSSTVYSDLDKWMRD